MSTRAVGGFLAVAVLISCGPVGLDVPPELAGRQPFVTKVVPEPDQIIRATDSLDLSFSHPIASESVNDSSIVVYASVGEEVNAKTVQEWWKEDLRGDVAVTRTLANDARSIQILPQDLFPPGRLALVVTPSLSSQDGLPFSQAPGVSNRPYVLWFTVVEDDLAPATSTGAAEGVANATSDTSPGTSSGAPPGGSSGGAALFAESPSPPATLLINEILYDVPGDDTNGTLFIELRGTAGASIGGYVVRCVNGANGEAISTIALPAAATIPADGLYVIADGITGNLTATTVPNADYVANFDPQNGPDAIQVLAADGSLLDVVGYGTPLPLHDATGLLMYEGSPAVKVSSGHSLTRNAAGEDTDNNAADFSENPSPSPGW